MTVAIEISEINLRINFTYAYYFVQISANFRQICPVLIRIGVVKSSISSCVMHQMMLMMSEMVQMIDVGWWGRGCDSCRMIPIVAWMVMMVWMMLMVQQWIWMIEVVGG